MFRKRLNKRGVVLLIVLATLLIVASLASAVLGLILSHARLVYHQSSRIQAYYAALAGMNLAMEKIRIGESGWVPDSGSVTKTLCGSGCDVIDTDIPYPVSITIWEPGSSIDNIGRKISVTSTYTYTAP